MNKTVDYYNILQVHHDAEKELIDAAYRCLSKMYHPDLNKLPQAAERMKEINTAYAVLGNEERRREYHRVWMQNNAWKTIAERDSGFSWHNAENKEVYGAFSTLDAFFRDTMNENWGEAYTRLTAADRGHVPFGDFEEWKKAVHRVYRLGNYSITFFRKYFHCEYGGQVYRKLFHFVVKVTELQLMTGEISEFTNHKYVALDGRDMKVCLGSRDLRPSIEKYRKIAEIIPKYDQEDLLVRTMGRIDLSTGVLNRKGWLEEAGREFRRGHRYGTPVSFAVIAFEPKNDESAKTLDAEMLEKNMIFACELIRTSLRESDVVGRCSERVLALLFPETKQRDGQRALEKLLTVLKENGYLRENFPCVIMSAMGEPVKPAGIEAGLDAACNSLRQ